MKTSILAIAVASFVQATALATLFSYDFSGSSVRSTNRADPSNAVGALGISTSEERTFDVGGGSDDLDIRLNLSSGSDGNLHAYLVHSSGFSVLLSHNDESNEDAMQSQVSEGESEQRMRGH